MSTTFVIFGATGDLTRRKLVPSLFRLHANGRMPDCSAVVGVGRKEMTDDDFRHAMREAIAESQGRAPDAVAWNAFAPILFYQVADLADPKDLRRVDEVLLAREGKRSGDRVYYLALPPATYTDVVRALTAAGMTSQVRGGPCRRIVIEKPFGRDQASARDLNRVLYEGFEESQVFRIDHYLGKETVQNIHVFRFANAIFEPVWNRNYVDSVQITVAESIGVGHRAGYYDSTGILRDIFQSHLLQLTSLTAMEPPARFESELLRNEKVKVLAACRAVADESIAESSVRGQYDGYLSEPGVAAGSTTATYAAVELFIDNWRWQGVPFYLRSGKALRTRSTDITIRFKKPPVKMFGEVAAVAMASNHLTMCIQPDESIRLRFETKVPDQGFAMEPSELDFRYRRREGADGHEPDAYERLLVDVLKGDASLFARADEIDHAWSIIDPLVAGWEGDWAPPLVTYPAGSWGPEQADAFLARRGRQWIRGCVDQDQGG